MVTAWDHVPAREWDDWRWQSRNRLRTLADLEAVFPLTDDERAAVSRTAERFHLGITPYYARLMDPDDPACPVRRQAIPTLGELHRGPGEVADPLHEDADQVAPGLTRRYPDRVLLYMTHHCAVYCRHYTRRRKVGTAGTAPTLAARREALAWIRAHPEIRDVVLSGGDPLTLGDAALDGVLAAVRAIPHVDVIRIGTRNPTTLPQRITEGLAEVLSRHAPIYVMTHFNHPRECTPEAAAAADRLRRAGCVLSNQMVLLRGVNDTPAVVIALNRRLLAMGIRPYRMFHCDYTEGTGHFRAPLERGLEILRALQGWTSGLMVPEYVVDLPGGLGKVPLAPRRAHREGGRWILESHDGRRVVLPEDAAG